MHYPNRKTVIKISCIKRLRSSKQQDRRYRRLSSDEEAVFPLFGFAATAGLLRNRGRISTLVKCRLHGIWAKKRLLWSAALDNIGHHFREEQQRPNEAENTTQPTSGARSRYSLQWPKHAAVPPSGAWSWAFLIPRSGRSTPADSLPKCEILHLSLPILLHVCGACSDRVSMATVS